ESVKGLIYLLRREVNLCHAPIRSFGQVFGVKISDFQQHNFRTLPKYRCVNVTKVRRSGAWQRAVENHIPRYFGKVRLRFWLLFNMRRVNMGHLREGYSGDCKYGN